MLVPQLEPIGGTGGQTSIKLMSSIPKSFPILVKSVSMILNLAEPVKFAVYVADTSIQPFLPANGLDVPNSTEPETPSFGVTNKYRLIIFVFSE
jgi:hypothetical protein